jgi:hypothetical protein
MKPKCPAYQTGWLNTAHNKNVIKYGRNLSRHFEVPHFIATESISFLLENVSPEIENVTCGLSCAWVFKFERYPVALTAFL